MPELDSTSLPPNETLRRVWFDGLVEGPRKGSENDAEIQRLVRRLERCGVGSIDLEFDGGRFSMLLPDTARPGAALDSNWREECIDVLQELQATIADSGTLESTMRCVEVYESQTVETLVAPVGQQIRAVSRVRPVSSEDQARTDGGGLRSIGGGAQIPFGRLVVVIALFSLVPLMIAWQNGLFSGLTSAAAESIALVEGEVGGVIAMELEETFSGYRLLLRRGPQYPTTPAERRDLLESSVTIAQRALRKAAVDGDELFARIENGDGDVLGAARVTLRQLLADPDAVVTVELDGYAAAVCVRLGLVSRASNR